MHECNVQQPCAWQRSLAARQREYVPCGHARDEAQCSGLWARSTSHYCARYQYVATWPWGPALWHVGTLCISVYCRESSHCRESMPLLLMKGVTTISARTLPCSMPSDLTGKLLAN
jgi:hypothetical protein